MPSACRSAFQHSCRRVQGLFLRTRLPCKVTGAPHSACLRALVPDIDRMEPGTPSSCAATTIHLIRVLALEFKSMPAVNSRTLLCPCVSQVLAVSPPAVDYTLMIAQPTGLPHDRIPSTLIPIAVHHPLFLPETVFYEQRMIIKAVFIIVYLAHPTRST